MFRANHWKFARCKLIIVKWQKNQKFHSCTLSIIVTSADTNTNSMYKGGTVITYKYYQLFWRLIGLLNMLFVISQKEVNIGYQGDLCSFKCYVVISGLTCAEVTKLWQLTGAFSFIQDLCMHACSQFRISLKESQDPWCGPRGCVCERRRNHSIWRPSCPVHFQCIHLSNQKSLLSQILTRYSVHIVGSDRSPIRRGNLVCVSVWDVMPVSQHAIRGH